ncbi:MULTISPECIES: DUF4166 domain-containing protein [unclassified Bosea (in: a-proteobacteria)]|uniref:DUF4166 domain-containing protein n=1 Tax=unclassified Bosea (in: a-proteobacteria) TaxID=2653178 RepID=UPI000F751863|nr:MULTISPECIES: DUF4166 domain-containing protein [unclassified Bosea (in: a-proteobacteria)]AZO78499.1 hypothetical protein BLM15_13395 [Bosea sp. Tri-49]RXT20008.1 hypothetical protein B5U98_18625 [Bosea sp. Tri-39]RXT36880.1 hypothetical protein B5U99_12945 [Bosea sp. Tri-54]
MSERRPVFQEVLGEDWHQLGEVIRRHYFLRSFSDDTICVKGVMHEVEHSAFARLLLPFARIVGALVPYRGRDVPIEVHYAARPEDGTLHWDRVFHFAGRKPFHFRSRMQQTGANQVIEFVRFGVGMRLRVTAEEGALVFRDEGYVWRLLGLDLPLPVGLLLGTGYIEERPIDERSFSMRMTLKHPLFGELFRYSGTFSLPEEAVTTGEVAGR